MIRAAVIELLGSFANMNKLLREDAFCMLQCSHVKADEEFESIARLLSEPMGASEAASFTEALERREVVQDRRTTLMVIDTAEMAASPRRNTRRLTANEDQTSRLVLVPREVEMQMATSS